MNRSAEGSKLKTADDFELHTALERSLCNFFGLYRQIVKLERRVSDYRSSFGLEELTVRLADGTKLSIMFKDMNRDSLHESGKRAKPEFIYNPEREIEVYNKILPMKQFDTATCYGNVIEPQIKRYWLFLEKVPGLELYQVGNFELWKAVAQWLADFHSYFASEVESLSAQNELLKYDEIFYREWIRRAQVFFTGTETFATDDDKAKVSWLAGKFDRVVEELSQMPRTLIHGEFYASNVLVQFTKGGELSIGTDLRICPIDWEMTGVGPSLIDLAALTSGDWNEDEKAALAKSYYEVLPDKSRWFSSQKSFEISLNFCRLYSAIQWLGWFGRRKPFANHAQDWLSEAIELTERLNL